MRLVKHERLAWLRRRKRYATDDRRLCSAEVAEGVALRVQRVRALRARHGLAGGRGVANHRCRFEDWAQAGEQVLRHARLAGPRSSRLFFESALALGPRPADELLRLGVLSAAGVDERLHLPPECLPDDVLLVSELAAELGQRQRLPREFLQLVDRGIGRKEHAVVSDADTRERLAGLVPGDPRPLGGGVGSCCGLRAVPEERLSEVELEHDVHPRRPRQHEHTLEQSGRGALVAPPERAPAGGSEPLARALRES